MIYWVKGQEAGASRYLVLSGRWEYLIVLLCCRFLPPNQNKERTNSNLNPMFPFI